VLEKSEQTLLLDTSLARSSLGYWCEREAEERGDAEAEAAGEPVTEYRS